jgi:hypothetical protein
MSEFLARTLEKFARSSGDRPTILADLDMTHTEYLNFQKLGYWGLVINPKRGTWQMTAEGWSFLGGGHRIHERVLTLRGKFDGYEGDLVAFEDILGRPGLMKASEYIEMAKPVELPGKSKQMSLTMAA